jgi:integrase
MKRLPVVLTQREVKRVFEFLNEPHKCMVGLMYGAGLRLNECLGLRMLDVDIERREITVRRGKGNKIGEHYCLMPWQESILMPESN